MTPDTTFRIASMTKMVATVAALQQVERGNLDLDEPIATYLPDFAGVQVLEGFDGDTPRLRPPASQATVRQLVTHTTGLTYWFWNADRVRWQECTGPRPCMSGDEVIFTAPLVADPGPGGSTGSTRTGSGASSRPRAGSRSTPTSPSTSSARSG